MPLLFSYGTLQHKHVQIENFGRELTGSHDVLPGYKQRLIPAMNTAAAAVTGQSHHLTIDPSSNAADSVSGMAFDVTAQELAAADRYEGIAGYTRIAVTLNSGKSAWVYARSFTAVLDSA